MRTVATLLRATLGLAAVALPSASCSLLWVFNNDPEGLPCADVDNETRTGRCLEGYACVFRENEAVCLKAGAKQAGEPCLSSEECDEDLVCATEYAQCGADGADDVNCSLVGEAAEGLACRPVCDIADPSACPNGERCFEIQGVEGQNGFCQAGACGEDADCRTVVGNEGLCSGETGQGKTGFCFEDCDPFSCAATSCGSCNGLDGAPDEGLSCFPMPDEVLSQRLVCLPHGGLPAFSPCGGPNDDICEFNTFCVNYQSSVYCAPFCNYPSGAPACPGGEACVQIGATGSLGFCAPG